MATRRHSNRYRAAVAVSLLLPALVLACGIDVSGTEPLDASTHDASGDRTIAADSSGDVFAANDTGVDAAFDADAALGFDAADSYVADTNAPVDAYEASVDAYVAPVDAGIDAPIDGDACPTGCYCTMISSTPVFCLTDDAGHCSNSLIACSYCELGTFCRQPDDSGACPAQQSCQPCSSADDCSASQVCALSLGGAMQCTECGSSTIGQSTIDLTCGADAGVCTAGTNLFDPPSCRH